MQNTQVLSPGRMMTPPPPQVPDEQLPKVCNLPVHLSFFVTLSSRLSHLLLHARRRQKFEGYKAITKRKAVEKRAKKKKKEKLHVHYQSALYFRVEEVAPVTYTAVPVSFWSVFLRRILSISRPTAACQIARGICSAGA